MEKLNNKNWIRGSCIGRGANGTVNLALNPPNDAVFAVKSVELSSCHPSQLQSLENEIKILKSISSPFIVKYLGDDTTPFHRNLHVEYLPRGASTSSSPVSEETLRGYLWCLLSALSNLHSRGIVHCDVKGKNVLLGSQHGWAKLADFGSAVKFGSGSVTRGSPLWMAPEVMRGEYQGPESDVWSLGCTVIEMLTCKPAWKVEPGSIGRIGYSDKVPVYPGGLSGLGRDFLDKCLRRDFRERWRCDQLLRHPFVVAVCGGRDLSLIGYSSPRCVLDGYDLEFDDERGDVEEEDEGVSVDAKERIRGLDYGVGANWEFSDEWVEVRGGGGVGGGGVVGEDEEEGTSLEYFELLGVDEEVHVASFVELSSNVPINVSSSDEGNCSNPMYDVVMSSHCDVVQFHEMEIICKIFVCLLFLFFFNISVIILRDCFLD